MTLGDHPHNGELSRRGRGGDAGGLRPLFSFYGAKWRLAPKYPAPRFPSIVEPFAGSAGYSCRYHAADVTLVERDPIIAGVWRFLVGSTASDIRALPLLDDGADAADLPVCQEARWLIGFWLNKATSAPRRHLSKWGRYPGKRDDFWGEAVRERIASTVHLVAHWRIIEGDYTAAPNKPATWFIDPPYVGNARVSKWTGDGPDVTVPVGDRYRFGTRRIDFDALGSWCRTRRGQVIACENVGATWLPFRPFFDAKVARGTSREAVWLSDERGQTTLPLATEAA